MELIVHFLALSSAEAPVKLNISTLTKGLSPETFSKISKILFQNLPAYERFSCTMAQVLEIPVAPLLSNSISLENLNLEFRGKEIMIIMEKQLVCDILDIEVPEAHELIEIRYFQGKHDLKESSSFKEEEPLEESEDFRQMKDFEDQTISVINQSAQQAKKYEFDERGMNSLFINSAFEANIKNVQDEVECTHSAKEIKRINKKLERHIDKILSTFSQAMPIDNIRLETNEIKHKIQELSDALSVVKQETYFRKTSEFIDRPIIKFPKDLSQIWVSLSLEKNMQNNYLRFSIENKSDFCLENLLLREKKSGNTLKQIRSLDIGETHENIKIKTHFDLLEQYNICKFYVVYNFVRVSDFSEFAVFDLKKSKNSCLIIRNNTPFMKSGTFKVESEGRSLLEKEIKMNAFSERLFELARLKEFRAHVYQIGIFDGRKIVSPRLTIDRI